MTTEIIGIGVDCGFTKGNATGLVVVAFRPKPVLLEHQLFTSWSSNKVHWGKRIADIGRQIEYWLDRHFDYTTDVADFIAVEMPFVHKNTENFQVAMKLCAMAGAAFTAAGSLARLHIDVNTMEAKKALTRNGKATKGEMMKSAYALTGVDLSPHTADALGVALAGCLLLGLIDSTGQFAKEESHE